jgi:DNA-binding MarR family transcriptional regulator
MYKRFLGGLPMGDYGYAAIEIIRLGLWNHRVQNAIAKEVDLPLYQLECVLILSLDRPDSVGSLAEQLGVHKSSVSKLLRALEERKLIERAIDPIDHRMERVTLTEPGTALAKRAQARAEEIAAELLAKLPEDRRSQFLGCVRTITSNEVQTEQQPQSSSVEPSHEPTMS